MKKIFTILLKIKPIYLILFVVSFLVSILSMYASSRTNERFLSNTTIVKSKGVYAYENTTNEFQTQFKTKPTDVNSIVFKNDLGGISFYTLSNQSFGEINSDNSPIANENTLTYPEIFPKIDLLYTISSSRLLEEFIVKDAETATQISRIEQRAKTDSTYKKNNDGSVTFSNKDKVAFTLPHPVMYETGNMGVKSEGIVYEIKKDGDQLIITKVITKEGQAWLADPKRAYPIAIDLVIDNGDTSSNWTSSDPFATIVSQETTIKQEGTGSTKVQTSAGSAPINLDLMEYSSAGTARSAYVTNDTFYFSATGGTITNVGGYAIHTFTNSGTFTVTSGSGNNSAQVLVVGGGGGAGSSYGDAPGGGGGAASQTTQNLTAQSYAVTVGAGGGTGGVSSVGALASANGGGQGNYGSGQGGTSGSGYVGGDPHEEAGGGGGGAIGNGGGASRFVGGGGGPGLTSSISGSSVGYGGGGGGAGSAGWGGSWGSGYGRGGQAGGGGSGIVIISYIPYFNLQSYSEATIKTQGTYALKGIAYQTTSLNKTLIRTFASPIDLSGRQNVTFDIRASRTGSNIKIGLHDSGGTTTEVTPNITSANVFQSVTLNLSGVTNANKDVIDKIIITVVNADAGNTFYLDNMVTYTSLNDTVTRTTAATDLSGVANITYWVRSSVTGSYATFGFGESVATEQTQNITIDQANTWEQKSWNIESISAVSRNAVTKYAFTFTGDTSGASFYLDDIQTNALFVPTLGTASPLSSTSVRWNFIDNSTEETGFKIYDSTGTTVLVTCATANLTYCDETGLSPSTQYTRKIGTYNASSDSIASGTVVGQTFAAALPGDYICTQATINSGSFTDRYLDGNRPGENPTRYIIGLDSGTGTDNSAVFEARSCIMTLNSTDTLAVGSLSLTGGSIAIADGGVIKIGQPVWIIDADEDGYSSDGKVYYGTQLAGYRRKNLATTLDAGNTDCNDGSYNTSNLCCTVATRYQDADGDTYGNPGVSISACTTAGYVDNNTDCNDASVSVFRSVAGYLDSDGDGYGAGAYSTCVGASGSYVASGADCNDTGTNAANVYISATCYADADNDNYGTGATKSCTNNATCGSATWASGGAGTAASSGNFAANNTDCNDASVSVFRSVAGYLDSDGDGYGAGAYSTCVGASGSYVASGADCYEGNANAKPGSTYCSATNRGDGSYDYNCAGGNTACGSTYYSYAYACIHYWRPRQYCPCSGQQYANVTTSAVGCGVTGYLRGGVIGDATQCQMAGQWFSLGAYGTQACQ